MKRTTFLMCLLCAFCLQILAAEHSYKQQPQKQTIKVGTASRVLLSTVQPSDGRNFPKALTL